MKLAAGKLHGTSGWEACGWLPSPPFARHGRLSRWSRRRGSWSPRGTRRRSGDSPWLWAAGVPLKVRLFAAGTQLLRERARRVRTASTPPPGPGVPIRASSPRPQVRSLSRGRGEVRI